MTVPFRPLRDLILVKPDKPKEQSKGGIFIPEKVQDKENERPQRGVVLALGPGPTKEGKKPRYPVAVGDVVYFSRYTGSKLELDDQTYVFLEIEHLLAEANT